jgi:uncharacterized membrane protein YadS
MRTRSLLIASALTVCWGAASVAQAADAIVHEQDAYALARVFGTP